MVREYPLIMAGDSLASFTCHFASCCIGVLLHGGYDLFSGLQFPMSPYVTACLRSARKRHVKSVDVISWLYLDTWAFLKYRW